MIYHRLQCAWLFWKHLSSFLSSSCHTKGLSTEKTYPEGWWITASVWGNSVSTVGQTSRKYSGNLRKRENCDWSTKKPSEIWRTFSWKFKSLRALHLSTAQTLFSVGGPVNRWDLWLALASIWLFPMTNQKVYTQLTSTVAQDRINCRSR